MQKIIQKSLVTAFGVVGGGGWGLFFFMVTLVELFEL